MHRALLISALLDSPEMTGAFAARLAGLLHSGDTLLLLGDIGAGKTHFARHLIRALQGPDAGEDIPSPTFTLVQTYDSPRGEIWHADLYRLSHVDEVLELGLDAAFDDAICLVEWPERLGNLAPRDALTLSFMTLGPEARRISAFGDERWADRLAPLRSDAA